MAATFSERLGRLSAEGRGRIEALLERLGLPTRPPELPAKEFLAAMSLDKKVRAGEIRLVLLSDIGKAEVTAEYPRDEMINLLQGQLVLH